MSAESAARSENDFEVSENLGAEIQPLVLEVMRYNNLIPMMYYGGIGIGLLGWLDMSGYNRDEFAKYPISGADDIRKSLNNLELKHKEIPSRFINCSRDLLAAMIATGITDEDLAKLQIAFKRETSGYSQEFSKWLKEFIPKIKIVYNKLISLGYNHNDMGIDAPEGSFS